MRGTKFIKKSVKLTDWEHTILKAIYKTHHTDLDFAQELNMNRVTAKRIVKEGSGREDSITHIRTHIRKFSKKLANA